MSRHLRVIKERRQNENVENDLRGFGDEQVFKTFYPQSVLTLTAEVKDGSFHRDLEKLKIDVSQNENNLHLSPKGSLDNFKNHAVHLFALALKHGETFNHAGAKATLWQTRNFESALRNAIEGHPEKALPTLEEFWKETKPPSSHHLWVAASCLLTLQQAGFDVSGAGTEGLGLHLEQATTLYQKELQKLKAKIESKITQQHVQKKRKRAAK